MARKVFAEFVGSILLLISVIGSGIMATNLTQDVGLQLTINMISIVFALGLIIYILGPISGAHFNPLVTLIELFFKRITRKMALSYVVVQFVGATCGTIIANLMFSKPWVFSSHHLRTGGAIWFSEVFATAGLIALIQILRAQGRLEHAHIAIPAWIGSAFFCSSSFIFANPAVTFARTLSDSFAGIAKSSVPMFVFSQLFGAMMGLGISLILIKEKSE